jgi:hypothetical protein
MRSPWKILCITPLNEILSGHFSDRSFPALDRLSIVYAVIAIGVRGDESVNRTLMTRTGADHRGKTKKDQRQSALSVLSAFY